MIIIVLQMVSLLLLLLSVGTEFNGTGNEALKDKRLTPWQEGYLDIHHIHTGGGNATFFVFPDATTMLFDAGEMDSEGFNKRLSPLRATAPHPNDSLSAGGWIAHYISQVMPRPPRIDYAVISHFHGDHYGQLTERSPASEQGDYRLTGITAVAEYIPIGNLVDRGYPSYDFPLDLRRYLKDDATFQNYLRFATYQVQHNGMHAAALEPGGKSQIQLQYQPGKYSKFSVRNVKTNGTVWTGKGTETRDHFNADSVVNEKGKFNENPLSLALKISYGDFDYYTGGDNTGLNTTGTPSWFDVETPLAKAVGPVDAMVLNHHGNRDATNAFFLKTLAPRVVIQQAWCSDQPGQEVYQRLLSRALYPGDRSIFATHIHEETKVAYGPWFTRGYEGMQGHWVIRVMPGGKQFFVFQLNDKEPTAALLKEYGPFTCR